VVGFAAYTVFVFSVEKSKATVLAGTDPLELPALTVYVRNLSGLKPSSTWASLSTPTVSHVSVRLPFDLTSVYQVAC